MSRLLRQPAGVCSQAAREQLTQRHLLVVRWVAGPRDGQLEERAGVRPERCERGLGFPALVQGLASGRCAPQRPLTSPCPCEQSQERQGAAADSPANFNAEDNQAAAPRLPQFRVSSVFAVDCLVEGEARLVVSPWAGLAIPSDWAHDCGVHRDLGALPYGESIGDNLYAATRELHYTAGANPSFRLEIGGLLSATRQLHYTAGANPSFRLEIGGLLLRHESCITRLELIRVFGSRSGVCFLRHESCITRLELTRVFGSRSGVCFLRHDSCITRLELIRVFGSRSGVCFCDTGANPSFFCFLGMSLTPLVSAEPPIPYRHLQAAVRQAARPCCVSKVEHAFQLWGRLLARVERRGPS